MSVVVQVETFE
jgi:cation-transporting ATPase 13A1